MLSDVQESSHAHSCGLSHAYKSLLCVRSLPDWALLMELNAAATAYTVCSSLATHQYCQVARREMNIDCT